MWTRSVCICTVPTAFTPRGNVSSGWELFTLSESLKTHFYIQHDIGFYVYNVIWVFIIHFFFLAGVRQFWGYMNPCRSSKVVSPRHYVYNVYMCMCAFARAGIMLITDFGHPLKDCNFNYLRRCSCHKSERLAYRGGDQQKNAYIVTTSSLQWTPNFWLLIIAVINTILIWYTMCNTDSNE